MATCAKCEKKIVFFKSYYYEGIGNVCEDCFAILEREANKHEEQRRLEAEQKQPPMEVRYF